MRKPNPLLMLAACVALAPAALAQRAEAPGKKLYCWNDKGQRVCSDALPAEAVNRAREEINAKSGMRTAEVSGAMTDEERSAAAEQEAQRRADQAAAETRRRTDQAMLMSYRTEDDLRRVFNERTSIVDNSIRTARYNVTSLREGLVSLLQVAGDRELAGKPVNAEAVANLRKRHAELKRQRQLQAGFETQRVALDAEIADILQRYRAMKGTAQAAEPVSETEASALTQ